MCNNDVGVGEGGGGDVEDNGANEGEGARWMMVMSVIEDIVLLMLVPFKVLMSIFKWGSIYSKKINPMPFK